MKDTSLVTQNQLLLSLINEIETLMGIFEVDGTLIFANDTPLKLSGLELSDVQGKKFWDCAWWNYDSQVQATIKNDCKQTRQGQHIHREIQLYTPHGLHWCVFNMQPFYDENNKVIYLVAKGRNVAELKQAELHSSRLKDYYENLIHHFNFPLFVINVNHQVVFWNKACEVLTGLNAEKVMNTNQHWRGFYDNERACLCDLILDKNYQQNLNLYSTHNPHPFVEDGKRTQNWCHMPSGKHLYLDIDACPIRDQDGNIIAVIEVLNDITEQMLAEKALNESEEKYRNLFEKTTDAILIIKGAQFVDCNPATIKMLAYENKEDLLNTHPSQLSPLKQADGRDSFEKANEMIAIAEHQGNHRFEWNHMRANGEVFPVEVLLTAVNYGGEHFLHVVWRDITKRKKIEKQLQQIAHYDVLTQLPNRALFADRFIQATAQSRRNHSLIAVCFLDLDDFKPVNDTYGHNAGDQLLVEVASRISLCIRNEDSVSRQGGDEFALLICNIKSYEQCEQLLTRLHQALAQPYLIEGQSVSITASCGVTLYPSDNSDLDTLLRHADQAMYQAKLEGKNKHCLFNTQDDQYNLEKNYRLKEIQNALANNELCLYYQPKVNMKTGHVYGAEALLRWIHPEKGLIPPLDFLPLIEGTSLEIELGHWVIKQALGQLDKWLQQGIELEGSVNISSYHLQSPVFFEQLNNALANYPAVNSRNLQLEILESSALGDINAISDIIKRCQHELGLNVALDDFGTGYSSLTHMKNLSANIIKIDQTFVRDMLNDPDDYSIIEGVIGLARAFNRDIIAEGVETTAHGLILQMIGCNKAQGYGIAKPMPADEFPLWLSQYTANEQWIDYATQESTIQEQKKMLFEITANSWLQQITQLIEKMDTEECERKARLYPLGNWLPKFTENQLFDADMQADFNQHYTEMNSTANKLFEYYQSGNGKAATMGLEDFKCIFEKINQMLAST